MANQLTFKSSTDTWYPASISSLEAHLSVLIKPSNYFQDNQTRPLNKNIAYNLQYVEFLDQLLKDIKLSSVLEAQSIKSFVVHGASIIEALFYYIVISTGNGAQTEWKSYRKFKSNQYEVKGDNFINETELFIKVSPPIRVEMKFDQMCKKVEKKKLIGAVGDLYTEISKIRKLRNRIHIQGIKHSTDTDWWTFNKDEFQLMRRVLYGILVSPLFSSSSHSTLFDYLK
ncbi:MAG: hypothetical protein WBG73_13690 [Coleofasciculaceae cyanobacterium]